MKEHQPERVTYWITLRPETAQAVEALAARAGLSTSQTIDHLCQTAFAALLLTRETRHNGHA